MAVQTQIQTRRGTAASWTSTNPTLAAGEFGYETDTGKFKIGNGSTAWASLAYTAASTAVTYLFNATSGQTTFSGADANGLTLAYTVGAEQVYLNGVLQVRGSDYTATNGTSIVLASGALTSDVLNVIAYSAMTITDTYTQAQADAKFLQVTNNNAAGKNAIINGGMDIWQRGTSFTNPGTSGSVFSADRWVHYFNGAGTVTQETSIKPATSIYAMKITATASSTDNAAYQLVEELQMEQFRGKAVTLSVKLAGTATVSPGISVSYSTTANDNLFNTNVAISTSVIANPTLNTSTYGTYIVQLTVPTTAKTLRININSNTMANTNVLYIAEAQLELGLVPTTFGRAGGTIAGELAACKYYYQRISSDATSSIAAVQLAFANSTTSAMSLLPIATMRTTPSVGYSAVGNFYLSDLIASANYTTTAIAISGIRSTNNVVFITHTVASGLTSGRAYSWQANTTSTYFDLSAEL